MVTLQEYLDQKYPTNEDKKKVTEIDIYIVSQNTTEKLDGGELDLSKYTKLRSVRVEGEYFRSPLTKINVKGCSFLEKLRCSSNKLDFIDLSASMNLVHFCISFNNLTSVDLLNHLPNPKKLKELDVSGNNIQPTNIEVFSKFTNLEALGIGTSSWSLENQGKRNQFYGSFKSWKNLTKLERISMEATDVDEGLEYLPNSLTKVLKEIIQSPCLSPYFTIACSSLSTNAKCKSIYDELESFKFDLEAWQKVNTEKMARVREEVFNNPSEIRWDKGNKEVIEKSTQTEVSVADKETQTEELSEKKEPEKLKAENEKLKTEHEGLNERVSRLEKQVERLETFSSHIQIPPK